MAMALRTFHFTKLLLAIHNGRGALRKAFDLAMDAHMVMEDELERSERIFRAHGLSSDDEFEHTEETNWLNALDDAMYEDAKMSRELFANTVVLQVDRLFRDFGTAAFGNEGYRVTRYGPSFGGELAKGGGYVAGTEIRFTRLIWALANSVRHFDEWLHLRIPAEPTGPLTTTNIESRILARYVTNSNRRKRSKEERHRLHQLIGPATSIWTIERALSLDPRESLLTWEGLVHVSTPAAKGEQRSLPQFAILEKNILASVVELADDLGAKASSQLRHAQAFIERLAERERRPDG